MKQHALHALRWMLLVSTFLSAWPLQGIAAVPLGQTAQSVSIPLLLPMRGHVEVYGNYPGDNDHVGRDRYAVDMLSDDTRVFPTAPGTIVFAGRNCDTRPGQPTCYGNVVVIDHGNGLYSVYTHLADDSFPIVTSKDRIFVNYTTRIGTIGESGCTGCGSHLHFAVRRAAPGLTDKAALFGGTSENVWGVIPGLPSSPGPTTIDRTAKTTPPGGVWSTPTDNRQVVTGRTLTLKARAYPSIATAPAIAYVNFTLAWSGATGSWRLACPPVATAVQGDRYECTVDLVALGAPRGDITVSFDVYDRSGTSHLAPHGTHRIRWNPGAVLGAAIAAPGFGPLPPQSDMAIAAPTTAPETTIQTVFVSIPGNWVWTDTGLDLAAGAQVQISADGVIRIAGSDPGKYPDGATVGGGPAVDPCSVAVAYPIFACWMLIGQIGNEVFAIGYGTSLTVTTTGRLYLGVNDDVFEDNSGSWTAAITISSS